MIITYKEFKDKVRENADVCFGSFRFDEADERKGREVSIHPLGMDERVRWGVASYCFFDLPLADSYKMDVYTEREFYFGRYFVKEDASVYFNADEFFIIAPNFLADIEKAYKRKNDYKHCCINNYVISSVSVACATWIRLTDYLKGKNEVEFLHGTIRIGECEQDEAKLTAKVRKYIGFAEKAFKKYLEKNGLANENEYLDMLARQEAEKKEEEKAAKKAAKERAKEQAYIKEHICVFDKAGEKVNFSADQLICRCLELGKNHGGIDAKIAEENGVECYEWKDYDGYSKRCNFTMVRRSFTLYLKKGYNIYIVGGLITFVRGEIKRHGVACEWIEQGKAIADIKTVKGFLVRGEHIVAKSLKEAQRISAEKRNKQTLSLLNARSKGQLVYQKLGNHMFTFEESLASGNCRPGTQNFKNRYEAAIGHEATEISLADLRKYGKKFGLEEYTERVIRYVMNKL